MTGELFSDRYEIQDMIGKGGMATVYHAIDTRFDRDVAIKVLPREFLHDHTFIDRFSREARTIAGLGHAAIVPIHDYGEQDGQPFMVMAYMPGGSLAARLRNRPLPLDQVQTTLTRVSEALDAAHARGIIHRDVKPANILYDSYGYCFLSDFGIVKLSETTAQLTGSGIVGTPAYMAPEMAEEGGLTHLIDVYALAVTLYQMLTGRQPFNADTPLGLLMAHATRPVPILRQTRPDLPETFQAVIEQGMAKDPAERYQSTVALAEAFRGALRGDAQPAGPPPTTIPEPITSLDASDAPTMDMVDYAESPPAGAVTRPEPKARKRSSMPWAWIGGIGAVVIIAIIGLFAMRGGGAEPPATAAPTAEPTPNLMLTLVKTGVSSNDEWEPYFQEFDGVQMALVPAGCFTMGSKYIDDEEPGHEICFDDPFWIDVNEVTNEQYGSASEDCLEWSSADNQPRICVDWYDAVAHCEARGMRLPTEAEWEYSARGPDSLNYPWGSNFDGTLVNFCDKNCLLGQANQSLDDGYQNTAPVGSYPGGASWVGVYDLGGNVWEWVNSLYMDYPYDPIDGREADGRHNSSAGRVLRGGSWNNSSYSTRAAGRFEDSPVNAGGNGYGFRCARDYEP